MDVKLIVAMATNKLEPLLTPNTYGPASGFLNKLCINNPQRAKPDPAIIAVSTFGSRISKKIVENNDSETSTENKLTLPKNKSTVINTNNMANNKMENNMKRLLLKCDFIN